jgi:hypothetical protein
LTAGNLSNPLKKNTKKTPAKSTKNLRVQEVAGPLEKSSQTSPAAPAGLESTVFSDRMGVTWAELLGRST